MGDRVKLLESGYWHVRLDANRFFQWPNGRAPQVSDGFPKGWVCEGCAKVAEDLAAKFME